MAGSWVKPGDRGRQRPGGNAVLSRGCYYAGQVADGTGGPSLRRFNVFILGVVLGAALLWVCAFAGVLGFTSVEGATYSALLLLVIVLADVTLGGLLARVLLFGNSASRRSRREAKGAGLFVGGSVFVGAVASGLFLGAMILFDTPASQRNLFVFAAGPGLGLVYGMVLGMPAVVGATLVEMRRGTRRRGSRR
jgi:MFS family permease